MLEVGHDVGSSLIDVTGIPLADLAQLDGATLERSLASLLPQHDCAGYCRCDRSTPRLWQNYDPTT
jgi:hypothetical protein